MNITGLAWGPQVTFSKVAEFCQEERQAELIPEKRVLARPHSLSAEEHEKNNLPDVVRRWAERDGAERARPRTAQSFCVPKTDIAAAGYDLSLNRYKEVEHEEVAHESPTAILADLRRIEDEIVEGMKRLEEMVG